ncbi:MAG: Asp-tRNA(Asn)/Glu-tRNA(Gln) amidotransferase subunit GatA [Phycisphaeraceae bacterium]|nr:Asp-tRNA(Asn)/Glu-tRNA(Gln) amidotransferase subunit GatA [Phycisphaeraceae bacterium]MCB9847148.1 Asp-tRNA(Asn)/Glu-tRNA(Gln) amidotransferase subunit GatA [Phycisphaeraceae bacterium]
MSENGTALTLRGYRDAIRGGAMSSEDAVRGCLAAIERLDGTLNAFTQVFGDHAIEDARAVDARIRSEGAERVGSLAGVPVAVKDNICLSWGRTTCCSRILEEYESPFTATAAQRLLDAGAVIVGKTNLDEFAMGSSTEHSCFGPSRNPWDPERAPGGSSGGSAAAVAAGMVPMALGSDTGGSIRQPAALCGIVGVKPTYGRVSRWGLVAFASSLDQIGPMTRTVEDAALTLGVICGEDALDSTSARVEVPDFTARLEEPIGGLRIGVPAQARHDENHPDVTRVFAETVERLRSMGAEIVDVDLPHMGAGIAAYYIVAPAEASSNLARYDGIRYGRRAKIGRDEDLETLYSRSRSEGFGGEVRRRIMLGTYALSSGYYDAYYNTALKARRLIKGDFDAVFSGAAGAPGVHAVLLPSTPTPAFRIGEKIDDPLALYLEDIFTVTANLAGIPGVSVPAGFAGVDGKRLPVGVQLLCPAFGEVNLLRIAAQLTASMPLETLAPVG